MRKPFIAANWKMNKTIAEAAEFFAAFVPAVRGVSDVDILIAPPFTAIAVADSALKDTNILLSAQDVFYEEKGAYTGEVAPGMLTDAGCSHVIIGHSERRQFFGDTDEVVNKKVRSALKAGLKVILCIGESLAERQSNNTNSVLKRQLNAGLAGIGIDEIVVAYEPIWAIGTGVTASPEQAQEAHAFVRGELRAMYQGKADAVRILYGGSVTPDNVKILMACPDVDGALVGGASLKPDSFTKLVRFKE